MLTTDQLDHVLPGPGRRAAAISAIALVHSRLLHQHVPVAGRWPTRTGFIAAQRRDQHRRAATATGCAAREASCSDRPTLLPGDLERLFPICTPDASRLRHLRRGARSCCTSAAARLPHAVLMMIPEAWENHAADGPGAARLLPVPPDLMEPWDGPACVAFTDGTLIGAVLDRNGLRPGRYWVTDDGLVVLASPRPGCSTSTRQGRRARAGCSRARCSWSTPRRSRIVDDDEIKAAAGRRRSRTSDWLHAGLMRPEDLPDREHVVHTHASVTRRQQTFGYTEEELRDHPRADGRDRRRADRLDGHRHPHRRAVRHARGCCSTTSPSCSPRSPTRRWTPSARSWSPRWPASIGPERQPARRRRRRPAASCSCRSRSSTTTSWPRSSTSTPTATCPASRPAQRPRPLPRSHGGGDALAPKRRRDLRRGVRRRSRTAPASSCCPTAHSNAEHGADPVAAAHAARAPPPGPQQEARPAGRADRRGRRRPRGAPRRAAHRLRRRRRSTRTWRMETVEDLVREQACVAGRRPAEQAVRNLVKALGKGVLKVMSKMGISTVASYTRRPDLRGASA